MRNFWAEGPEAIFCATALCCFKSDCYTENPVGLCTLLATADVATSCDTAVQAARDAGVGRDNCWAKNERRVKIVFGAFDLCLALVRPRRSNEMDGLLRLIIGDANHCWAGRTLRRRGEGAVSVQVERAPPKLIMIWQFSELCEASVMLVSNRRSDYVVCTQRRGRASAQAIVDLFFRWYRDVGLRGCSSHNGRRTFIVGEFLGAQGGHGLVIATAQNTFDASGVFGVMLVIGILALAAEALMSQIERRVLAWRPKSASENNIAGI